MAEQEEPGRFTVELASEITSHVRRGLQNLEKFLQIRFNRFIDCHKCTRDIPGSAFI